jgi:hypothetical protein
MLVQSEGHARSGGPGGIAEDSGARTGELNGTVDEGKGHVAGRNVSVHGSNVPYDDQGGSRNGGFEATYFVHNEGRQVGGASKDADFLQKVSSKLRELGPWKPGERTEQKLAWLTSFAMCEVEKAAGQCKIERKGFVDEFFESSNKLLGHERAQAFSVWLAKCLDETGKI